MSPPTLVIRIALEGRLTFVVEAANESEHDRLEAWLATQPKYLRLIEHALEIDQTERAA